MIWQDTLTYVVGLLAVLNPIGIIPVFTSLTADRTIIERDRIARQCAASVVSILILSAFAGDFVLEFFGIRLSSFQIGGGLVIMTTAFHMINAHMPRTKQTRRESEEASESENISVVPLAIPLLAGPGSISTTILYSHGTHTWQGYLSLSLSAVLIGLIVWAVLHFAPPLVARLGRTGLNVITRVMGLILMAISIEFITNGLGAIFPGLAR